MYRLISSIFLGWGLGSNNSGNIFGTAVASRAVKYSNAVILASLFIILGALFEGHRGMYTISNLTSFSLHTAFIASLASALTVALMTMLKLPVSTSQAVVGAIIGIGMITGRLNLGGLGKVVICWIGTPLGTMILSMLLYPLLGRVLEKIRMNIFTRGYILKAGLVITGCYGAYALGANNVANITGVYARTGLLTEPQAVLVGALSMAIGVLSFSRNVMMTIGKKLVKLDPYSGFIAVLSESVVVHMYAIIGVPVSTSQAIIGAVLGIGLLKGVQTIHFRVLFGILFGWIGTPLIAGVISYGMYMVMGVMWGF
jgi:PiT family inorganic phosphate transporter